MVALMKTHVFPKPLLWHFKKHNFDALLISTHAPGLSAYNQVERRMAPLSKALTGLLLPYNTFGNHLDSQRRTIDVELEKHNFKKAGEVLVKVWNELLIDKFPVVCEYLKNSAMEPVVYEGSWVSKHCRILQYFFQVVKCTDEKCCGPFRTGFEYFQIDFFLLPFSSDKMEVQLSHQSARSKQQIITLVYGNA